MKMSTPDVVCRSPHPCDFRLARVLDRGWGEMAFEYYWDSTSGLKDSDGQGNPDLADCVLYEYTTYSHNAGAGGAGQSDTEAMNASENSKQLRGGEEYHAGRYADCCYYPPDPPFLGWEFRDPTDGRTAPVALGCFAATQGWAWDRHKTGGRLRLPEHQTDQVFTIAAVQEYRFHCSVCGLDARIPGSHSGPHVILRRFEQHKPLELNVWRYSFQKHHHLAYMDVDAAGYVDDSAHIGFGP